MDQPEKSQPVVGYTSPPYQTVSTLSSNTPPATVPAPAPAPPPSTKLAFPQPQPFNQQPDQIEVFWTKQLEEAEQVLDFKIHSLPLARIKKIMKADEDVRMISAEAPVVFAKACEMFILELTLRSWIHTEENKRRTLQKNDIAAAISRTDVFDFLVDIIPRDELKEDGLKSVIPMVGGPADMPYYFVPPQHHHHPMGPTEMMMGNPVDQAVMYGGGPQPRPPPPAAFMPWPPTQAQQPMSHQQQQTES